MAQERMNELPEEVYAVVKFYIDELIVGHIGYIDHINTMRLSENKSIENEFPSLIPAFVAQLRPRHFLPMLQKYRGRFESSI